MFHVTLRVQARYRAKSENSTFFIWAEFFFIKALKYRDKNVNEKFIGLSDVQNVDLQLS